MKLSARARKSETSATMVATLGLMLGIMALLALFALTAAASQPGWWTTRDAVDPTLGTNDYGVVNEGQLKQFTARAVDELNADLTNGAGPDLTNLVYGWQQDYLTNGYNATNLKPSDFNAMSVGQLKYIASLVYSPLAGAGYTGLTPSWIVPNTNTDNLAATAGQLKQVFAWDITVAPATVTSVVATASNPGEIDLTWTLPTMNNATYFLIEQSTDGGSTWTTAQTLTDPTLNAVAMTGLTQGISYEFRITAINPVGASAASAATSPTTAPITPRYVVIDLGVGFQPVAVNATGTVAGNNSAGAIIWSQGSTNSLPASPLGTGYAAAINDAGNVAGQAEFVYARPSYTTNGAASLNEWHACIWTNATTNPTDLDTQQNHNTAHNQNYLSFPTADYDSKATALNSTGVLGVSELHGWDVATVFAAGVDPVALMATNNLNSYTSPGPYTTVTAATGTNWCGYFEGNGSAPFYPIVEGTLYTNTAAVSFEPYGINNSNFIVGVQGANAVMGVPGVGGNLAATNLGTGIAYGINDFVMTNVVAGVTNVAYAPQIVGVDGTGTNGMLWDQTMNDGTPTTNTYVAKDINSVTYGATTIGTNAAIWHIRSTCGINPGGAIPGIAIKWATGTTNGVLLVPVSITRDGLPIYPSNNTVWVGQQISLTNTISGLPTSAITSWKWAIPGAKNTPTDTAFYDYEPYATNSNYTNLFTPTDRTTSSFIQYYWSSGGSNQVVYCTNVIYGQTTVIATMLNVSRPLAGIIATTNAAAPVAADTNYFLYNTVHYPSATYPAWLHFGPHISGVDGILFSQTNSMSSGGAYVWNQIINSDSYTITNSSSVITKSSSGYDGASDDEYPYTLNPTANDSPGWCMTTTEITMSRNFNATMYLMWKASSTLVNGDKSVVVPLKSFQWNWLGRATNNAGTWTLAPGSASGPTNTVNVDVTSEPTWSTNAAHNWH